MYKILMKKAITLLLALFLTTELQGCSYSVPIIVGTSIATIGYFTDKSSKKDSLTKLQTEVSADSAQIIAKNDSLKQKKESQTEKTSKGQVAFGITMGVVAVILPFFLLIKLFQASPGLGD
ncbi:MAG: hypothetical protein J6W51_04610 [Fibrobacter sp.]|nr:hypothetical protein [Fibrobacter sp.]